MYKKTSLFIVISTQILSSFSQNNACRSFDDYRNAAFNRNCFYNPENYLETPGILRRYSSNYQTHRITTEDGYILTMFRLPAKGTSRGTVLMQHPLSVNSRIYVGQGPESSIGIVFWNAGYDVWFNNMRGTLFSQSHVNLSSSSSKFWDYSLHEIGYYDIPRQIQYIKEKTGVDKIIYIGHSLGTTSALIYASTRGEEAARSVKAFILLSPAVFFDHAQSIVVFFRELQNEVDSIMEMLNWSNFLFLRQFILQLLSTGSRMFPILPKVISLILCLACGWTPDEADPAIVNFDVAINLQTFSTKLLRHYLQLLVARTRFQNFDYGPTKNQRIYNSEIPPEYPLDKITVPVYLISSINDSLTTYQDANFLFNEKLSNETRSKGDHWIVEGLNHCDFQIGKHKREIFLDRLLDLVKSL